MKNSLPTLLSFNGGYVDTMGFLTLNNLFTAHVTGNFVMIADAFVHGSTGILPKLLALPVFCLVILATRSFALRVTPQERRAMMAMLGLKFLLFAAAAALALHYRAFPDPDGAPLISVGMLLVAAMAIQNGVHRAHLKDAPPTTLMTGTTTQIMLDLATLLYPQASEDRAVVRARMFRFLIAVIAFALGCGLAAAAELTIGFWSYLLPPLVALVSLGVHARKSEA